MGLVLTVRVVLRVPLVQMLWVELGQVVNVRVPAAVAEKEWGCESVALTVLEEIIVEMADADVV